LSYGRWKSQGGPFRRRSVAAADLPGLRQSPYSTVFSCRFQASLARRTVSIALRRRPQGMDVPRLRPGGRKREPTFAPGKWATLPPRRIPGSGRPGGRRTARRRWP